MEVVVDAIEAEFASGVMWANGVAGIEERDEPDGRVRLIGGVPPESTSTLAAALDAHWPVVVGRLEPERWADEWRAHATAARLDAGYVIQPPWVEPIAEPGDTVISLDPGRAWGHGAHPSSVLAANDLVWLAPSGARVLDVGCGSGVLSLVAAAAGARHVLAVDVDLAAVEATLANAMVNDLADRIDASATPVALVEGPFDVVVANIGLGVLVELAPRIASLLAPGGALVLSGLLADQADEAIGAYAGFEVVRRTTLDGWTSVVLRS